MLREREKVERETKKRRSCRGDGRQRDAKGNYWEVGNLP